MGRTVGQDSMRAGMEGAKTILRQFAIGDLTMPQTEERLKMICNKVQQPFKTSDWRPFFDVVFAAEDDDAAAVSGLEQVLSTHTFPLQAPTRHNPPNSTTYQPPELSSLQSGITTTLEELKDRGLVRGHVFTVQELLNPVEEQGHGISPYAFEGGDAEIVKTALQNVADDAGLVEEESESDDDDEVMWPVITRKEGIEFCTKLERLCLEYDQSNELNGMLRKFRAILFKADQDSLKQVSLTEFGITLT